MIHGIFHSGIVLSVEGGFVPPGREGLWVSLTPGDGMPNKKIFLTKEKRGMLIKGVYGLLVIKTFQDLKEEKTEFLVPGVRQKEAQLSVGDMICYYPGGSLSIAERWCVVPPSGNKISVSRSSIVFG